MSTSEYYLEDKKVTKEEYEAFHLQLGKSTFYSCAKMVGGGRSTSKAMHNTNNKTYYIISTMRQSQNIYQIKLAD
jgi:hypothetical protein